MKDIFKNELVVGDFVAFTEPGYTYTLCTGTILKFTPKKILIGWTVTPKKILIGWTDHHGTDQLVYKFPKQVAKKH